MALKDLEAFSLSGHLYQVQNQLFEHIRRRSLAAFARGDAARDAVATLEQWRQRRDAIRQQLVHAMGGLPEGGPLNACVTGRESLDGITIEKLTFESRPGHVVTANLYLPDGVSKDAAAVLFLCGHHRAAKMEPEYQAVCQVMARHGLIVLAQDPVGQGERMDYFDPDVNDTRVAWGTHEHDYAGAQCKILGQNIARYFVHDAMRGMDYLASRPEVDPARIGVTGNSGGGTQTALMMMLDPRVAAAAPGTFIMSREAYFHTGQPQDAEQVWHGFTAAGYDHEDILLAMADRAVCVLAVTWDFFPIEGTRRTVQRAQRFFDLAGGALQLVEVDSVHAYTPKLAHAAASFFVTHLAGGQDVDRRHIEPTILNEVQLRATATGQVRSADPDARGVHDECLATLQTATTALSLQAFEQLVHRDRKPCPLNPRRSLTGHLLDMNYEVLWWWSQEDLIGTATTFHPMGGPAADSPVMLALWDHGTNCLQTHLTWIQNQTRAGRSVMVLDVTAHGSLEQASLLRGRGRPTAFYGVLHRCAIDLDFLGDSLAAMRTFDVIRALDLAEQWTSLHHRPIRGYGVGKASVYLRLAALIDRRLHLDQIDGGISQFQDVVRQRYYDCEDIHSQIFHGCIGLDDLS